MVSFIDDRFYSKAFHDAVEEEYAKAGHGKLKEDRDDSEAARDKKRIRDKVRRAGMYLVVAEDGHNGNIADVMDRLVESALDRLGQAEPPWLKGIDWARIFAVFANEAWPNLGAIALLRRVAEEAVEVWMAANSTSVGPRKTAARTGREAERVIQSFPKGAKLGVMLAELRVEGLRPGSIGENHFVVGDVVTALNGRRVSTQEELLELLEAARPGPVCFRIVPAPTTPGGSPAAPAVDSLVWLARVRGDEAGEPATRNFSSPAQPAPGAPQRASPKDKAPAARPPATMVILNCEDIGRFASKCEIFRGQAFPWAAIEATVAHFAGLGLEVQPVVCTSTTVRHPPPKSLEARLVRCPVVDMEPGSLKALTPERVFVLRLAQTYGCWWVDNTNYRAATWQGHASWDWLQASGLDLKVEYLFDPLGTFVPLRDVSVALRAAG